MRVIPAASAAAIPLSVVAAREMMMGIPAMGGFPDHTGRLSSRTSDHAAGEVNPVQDRVSHELIHRVMPAHIAALGKQPALLEEDRAVDTPGLFPELGLDLTGDRKYVVR